VPGFHLFLPQWATQTKPFSKGDFVSVPRGDPLLECTQQISMRKGSLVVWSSRMPHCNYPNDGETFRYNQYIKMFPTDVMGLGGEGGDIWKARGDALRQRLPSNLQLSELGACILGLSMWGDGEAKEEGSIKKKKKKKKKKKTAYTKGDDEKMEEQDKAEKEKDKEEEEETERKEE